MIKKRYTTDKSKINAIEKFLSKKNQVLIFMNLESDKLIITQDNDKKSISFSVSDIEEVLERKDNNEDLFLQLNFKVGKKMLLTKEFVGFAPAICHGLDEDKLPKVVTTSDLLSVIEAIESSLYGKEPYEENLSEVKLFFEAIACGAESVGFNLTGERLWVEKLISNYPVLSKKHVV
ncbi:MAG: hypothetical protein ACR2M7_00605 [Bdellovibrionales bacterium]